MIRSLSGVNRRQLNRLFLAAGGTIAHRTRTGEDSYWHPVMGRRGVTVNARRKDASRQLSTYVRQALERVG